MPDKMPTFEIKDKKGNLIAIFFNKENALKFNEVLNIDCKHPIRAHNESIFSLGQCQYCFSNKVL